MSAVNDKKTKATKSVTKKRAPKKVEEPVKVEPVPEPVPEPIVEVSVEDEVEEKGGEAKLGKKNGKQKLYKEIGDLVEKLLQAFEGDIQDGKFNNSAKVAKRHHKELVRINAKLQKIQKKSDSQVKNTTSGFAKATPIVPEMSAFAGWKEGEHKSRTQVNNVLCSYIRENKLQKADDKRVIIPDAKLAKLLKYDPQAHGELTFATMQRRLGHLFVKPAQ